MKKDSAEVTAVTAVLANSKKNKTLMIFIALLSVYIFWGGTYLGMKIAIETIPSFIMAGMRFLIAGMILYVVARLSGAKRPVIEEWKGTGIVGALLLLSGNGVVAWAEQSVPSGITSLLLATVPLWIAVLNWLGPGKEKPNTGTLTGIILGIAGIIVMVIPQGRLDMNGEMPVLYIIIMLLAAISWSAGSVYSRAAKQPDSPLLTTAMQMITGGTLLIIFASILGDWPKFHINQISIRSYAAFGYLVIFGSIVGYNAYIWLLKNAEPSLVSTYAFVNPVVAVFMGWLILGEKLTLNTMIASVIIISAVFVITYYRNRSTTHKAIR